MKTIHLHGSLGETYGKEFRLDIERPSEAIEALGHQLQGFFSTIAQGDWTVWRDEESIDGDMLRVTLDNCTDLHIVPALEGAKGGGKGGIGKVILGVALIAVAVVAAPAAIGGGLAAGGAGGLSATAFAGISYGQIALLGGAIALGGVTSLITPVPSTGDIGNREDPTAQRNGVLGGQGNTTEQGQPVPLPFGLIRTGSQLIQVGLYTEEMTPTDYVESNAELLSIMRVGERTDPATGILYTGMGVELYAPIAPDDPKGDVADVIPPYGSISNQAFREKTIAQIAERIVEGQRRLEVVIKHRDLPINFFDRIRITERATDNPVWDLVTLSVDNFDGQEFEVDPVPEDWDAGVVPPPPNSSIFKTPSVLRSFTHWAWDIGSAKLVDGDLYNVYLEYTK